MEIRFSGKGDVIRCGEVDDRDVDGRPVHQAAEDEHAVQILQESIAYANQRWGRATFDT